MPVIKDVKALKILNSRADYTIKTWLEFADGTKGRAIVPEGASKGEHEAVSLDADQSIKIINEKIKPTLKGKNFNSQEEFDRFLMTLDGTPDKRKLGGNTILALSISYARATKFLCCLNPQREHKNITLLFNILNGGKHAQNVLSFQEFMLIPAKKYNIFESVEVGRTVYKTLKKKLEKDGYSTGVGDEGGFAPKDFTVRKALKYIKDCASENYKVGEDVFLGMDVAAESFYVDGKYRIAEEKLEFDSRGLKDYYADLLKSFEIIYLEDPFFEEDKEAWKDFTGTFGTKFMISADDLVVTNPAILEKAIKENLANTVIVKPNQVGTITETIEFTSMARKAGWGIVDSHRSGDTEDTFIADLAYYTGADFVKFGAPARSERTSKYNRLLEITDAEQSH